MSCRAHLLVWIGLLGLLSAPAWGQFPVNVVQDCWTTNFSEVPDAELEGYSYSVTDPITFVWKHKILLPCSNYVVRISGHDCRIGKPKPGPRLFQFRNIQYGAIDPDPAFPELLFAFTAPPGSIPPGIYDWFVLVECNDSGNGIPGSPDGDIDDECGINVGAPPVINGPRIFGPEPIERLDPDPGGAPPGRVAGEEGTTRPWCFEVTDEPA